MLGARKQRKKAEKRAKEAQELEATERGIAAFGALLEQKLVTQKSHERRMKALRVFLAQIGASGGTPSSRA
jgi:hypothetical protein